MAEKENVKAEFSMGLMDYQRFNSILERKAEIEYRFFMGYSNSVPEYFSILKVFYYEMRAAIVKTPREQLDKKLLEIEFEKNKNKKRRLLENLNNELMDRRQSMGIGIPVFFQSSEQSKIKNALGG